MPGSTRARSRRDRRGTDADERMRRAQRAQQAAYEAARTVLDRAAQRRDAEWRNAAKANRRRAFTVLFAPFVVGAVIGALGALVIALAVVGAVLVVGWAGLAVLAWLEAGNGLKRVVGGMSVDDAVGKGVVSDVSGARFADVTQGLCASLGLRLPQLWVLPDKAPNAVTVGHSLDDARIVATSSLLESLDRIELEGVLAHELSHVKRFDMRTGSLAGTTTVRALDALTGGRVSRYLLGQCRELEADVAGVSLTRYPPGLLAALEKVTAGGSGQLPELRSSDVSRLEGLFFVPSSGDELSSRLDVLQEL